MGILLNIKGISFILEDVNEVTLKLRKSGECIVKASDIELPDNVKIKNPDTVIANLNEKGELDMLITVSKGRGYESAENRNDSEERKKVGWIQLDASYSPINNV